MRSEGSGFVRGAGDGDGERPWHARAVGCHPPYERVSVYCGRQYHAVICPCTWADVHVKAMLRAMYNEMCPDDKAWVDGVRRVIVAAMLG